MHLAALTLGYSRRLLIRAIRSEKQAHWLATLEEGFRHWGGVPQRQQRDAERSLRDGNASRDQNTERGPVRSSALARPLAVYAELIVGVAA